MLLIPDTNRTLYNLYCNVRLSPLNGEDSKSSQWNFGSKTEVKELGPDQPDGLIYCEELFVELCAAPPQNIFTSCHCPKRFTIMWGGGGGLSSIQINKYKLNSDELYLSHTQLYRV